MDKMRIHEMLECMTEWALAEMKSKGKEHVDTKEMGEVIDMIKDLAEAEKCVHEKCYFKAIHEAMEEEKEAMKDGRMGYDRWRTSSGRFAPKGTGHETSMATATGRTGYMPEIPYYEEPDMWAWKPWLYPMMPDKMGYDGGMRDGSNRDAGRSGDHDGSASRRPNVGDGQSANANSRMGYTDGDRRMSDERKDRHSQYQDAKRYFHESGGTQDAKVKMDEKASEYLEESIETMRDIFIQADPRMQQKMKEDISRLFREMGGK